ncbi:hypothetical protein L6255_04445 [Candidatus Parcubacteria bacterium]|nr:hypothetical protein [Patescibacteria group bacterium]MCG2689656.1 hypothetical protein [Candidatus Parcubacteria bacterium]
MPTRRASETVGSNNPDEIGIKRKNAKNFKELSIISMMYYKSLWTNSTTVDKIKQVDLTNTNMTSITKAILTFTVLIILFFVYAYGVFFQIPIFNGYPLTLQHVFEPIFYVFIFAIGNYYIYKSVYFRKIRSDKNNDKQSIVVPTFLLLLFLGIGFGVHTTAQLIEDFLGHQNESLLYQIVFFLDEGPGHWLVSIPLLLLYFFLLKIELNREKNKVNNIDKFFIIFCSLIIGLGLGISGFEGNFNGFAQHFLMTPIIIGILYKIYRYRENKLFKFWIYPFTTFLVLTFSIYLIFTLVFGLSLGFTINPDADLRWIIKLPF